MLADNGPQYSSMEFVKFADDYNFKHVTSSPYYPQNNGYAESAVQRVKQTFGKKVVTHTSHYSLIVHHIYPGVDIHLQNYSWVVNFKLIHH